MTTGQQLPSARPPYRELEFWASVLGTARHRSAFDETHLEAAFSVGLRYATETAPAHVKCLAHYVIGRALLLLRDVYPEWSEWVAHATIQAGEWALVTGEPWLQDRTEALFEDYVRCIK